MDSQTARQDQDAFFPAVHVYQSWVKDWAIYHALHCTYLRLVIALPRAQLASGLIDSSIEASTIGTLRNSSPNMSLNATKTPWSKPGPSNPRPSRPRVSSFVVKRALIPAYRKENGVRGPPRLFRGETVGTQQEYIRFGTAQRHAWKALYRRVN